MRCGNWALAAALGAWLLTAPSVSAGQPNGVEDSGICPSGFVSTFNANGVGCTFCANPDPNECQFQCVIMPPCICPPESLDTCCAETPCCTNCPDNVSLECSVATCECTPDTEECCKTICPVAGAPALGSPLSPVFALVATVLAMGGALLVTRKRRRAPH
jgi:hypothetical protein